MGPEERSDGLKGRPDFSFSFFRLWKNAERDLFCLVLSPVQSAFNVILKARNEDIFLTAKYSSLLCLLFLYLTQLSLFQPFLFDLLYRTQEDS